MACRLFGPASLVVCAGSLVGLFRTVLTQAMAKLRSFAFLPFLASLVVSTSLSFSFHALVSSLIFSLSCWVSSLYGEFSAFLPEKNNEDETVQKDKKSRANYGKEEGARARVSS